MEESFRIVFSKPTSIIGKLVCWRTKDNYSHSWIELDGVIYDPSIVYSKRVIVEKKIRRKKYPADLVIELKLTKADKQMTRAWAEDWIGTKYDFLSIIGWLLGAKEIESSRNSYCHEFCRHSMVRLGKLPADNHLITAEQLEEELIGLKGVVLKKT